MGPNEAVLKYLKDQNRPYSTNDIVMNLHKEYGKTAVQKSLDHLVGQGKIREKAYGKQKVYVIQQDESEVITEKELTDLDAELNKLNSDLKGVEEETSTSEKQLRDLLEKPTTENAVRIKEELESKMMNLKSRLKDLSENSVIITPEEREKVRSAHEKYMKEWRKRRSLCMDIVNSIMEGYPKSKKTLMEEIGIETDEDAGVSLPK